MKAAIDGEIDAMLGFISLQYLRAKFLSETRMYASVPLAIVVPPGAEYGDLEKFTRPFSFDVWIVMLAVFAIACTVTVLLTHLSENVFIYVVGEGVKNPLYNLFAVFFGIPQHILPRKLFARYILMCFMLYSLILRNVYQGGVFQILKSNDRKPVISTIRELIDQKFAFYMYESLAARLVDFEFYPLRVIYPISDIRKRRMLTLDSAFKGVIFNYLPQVIYNNQKNYNNYTFSVCKENFITSPMVFYFKKNHFLVEEINEKLDLLIMNGVVGHFTQKYADPRFLKVHDSSGEAKVLTLKHFKGAFQLLLFPLAVATSVFCIEVLTKIKIFKRKPKKFQRTMFN